MIPHFGYSNFKVFIISSIKAIFFIINLVFLFYLKLPEVNIIYFIILAMKFLPFKDRSQAYFFLFCIFSCSNSFVNKFIKKLNAIIAD